MLLQALPKPRHLIRNLVAVVAVVAVLLSGFLAYTNYKYAGQLAEARALVQDHIRESRQADGRAARAELVAKEAVAQKDSIQAEAAEHATRAQTAEAKQAQPLEQDTSATAKIAVDYKRAYEKQKQATARLQWAYDTLRVTVTDLKDANANLRGSAAKLVDASRQSFWDRIVPDVGVGCAAGMSTQARPDAVCGVTLSYKL